MASKITQAIATSLGGRMDGRSILVQCYRNLLEMVEDRELRLVQSCQSAHALLAAVQNAEPVLVAGDDDGGFLHVYVDAEERTGVKFLRQLRDKHAEEDSLLIVNVEGATPFTKKEVGDDPHVEFWMVRELLLNPTRHKLVPPHRLMPAAEVDALQSRRCIADHQWPVMYATDIVARWYKFPKGGIVHIERRGIGHEKGDYYRKVV